MNPKILIISIVGASLLIGALVLNSQSSQNSLKQQDCEGGMAKTSYCRN